MDLFSYNKITGVLELKEDAILLIPEFEALLEPGRNKCAGDTTGKKKSRAFREFKYMWLVLDWNTIYKSDTPGERDRRAITEAKLSEEEYNDPIFRAACRRYQKLQNEQLPMKLLAGAEHSARALAHYFEMVTIGDRTADGKLITNPKEVMDSISKCGTLITSLKNLEMDVKKSMQTNKKVRGDSTPGWLDNQ